MDIAYFISDLLGEQGELTVPNLGYFVQMRMSAYYNEQESKFYPPHYSIQFDPQVIDDDDTLATHIHERKKISLASAKYFIEKYITSLREQALVDDVPFGGIGHFSTNGVQLVFKPSAKMDDPSFFGFKAIEAYRIGQERPETVTPPPAPVYSAPVETTAPEFTSTPEPAPATVYSPPLEPEADTIFPEPTAVEEEMAPEYEYEEERRGVSTWLIVGIVLVVLVAAAGALYKFKPELFGELLSLHKDPYQHSQPAKPVVKPDTAAGIPSAKPDTAAQSSVLKTDTVSNKPASAPEKNGPQPVNTEVKKSETKPPSTAKQPESKPAAITAPAVTQPAAPFTAESDVPKGMWVIYGGAHPERKPALRILENYKSLGLTQARLLKDHVNPGNNYKIILGAFSTKQEAEDRRKEILATAKISSGRLSVEQLK